jgi:RNA polymerase sigma factor (sigma-70 family)
MSTPSILPSLRSVSGAILSGMRDAGVTPVAVDPSTRHRALIAAMAQGDETALNALYEATLSRIYGLALRVTGRKDLAEDVVVEVYWQAWRDAGRYDASRGEPMAWLYTICRSRALDILRRRDDAELHPDPEELIAGLPGRETQPLDALCAAEAGSALAVALESLTPVQRQMVALAFFRGLSHQEVAEHTGLPLGTVKSHLKRAQDALRLALGSG